MKKTLATITTAFTLALAAACGGGSSQAVGVYKLDTASLKAAALADIPADQRAQFEGMLGGMFDKMDVSMELKADGTAVGSTKGAMGKPDADESGTWTLEGTQLTIKTKDASGKEQTQTGTLGAGQFKVPFEQDGKKFEVVFKKQ